MELAELISELDESHVKYVVDVNLKEYTHTKTGGEIPVMVYPSNIDELIVSARLLTDLKFEFIVLSGMTNIVLPDQKLDFVVLNMSEFETTEPIVDGNILTVSGSHEMKTLTRWSYNNQLRSLEWMEGIPGTVGAGIYMNAGFLIGQDMEHFLVDATYLDLTDFTVKTMKNQDMKFRYRYSIFQEMDAVILKAKFLVTPIKNLSHPWLRKLKSKKIIDQYHQRRANNQPLEFPSAGTVFVPPTPFHVGGLLREMKLVGHQIGGAQISPKSPGFIVGVDNMTGDDYYDLVKFIQEKVFERYGLSLEPEVRLIGFDKKIRGHFGR